MNILRLIYEWPPSWDGMTPGPFELTRAQVEKGHQVHVLCGGWPTHDTEPLPNVKVTRLPVALPRLSLFATTAPSLLPAMIPHLRWADVIHGHGHVPAGYHAWRSVVGGKTPYLLHIDVTAKGRRLLSEAGGASLDFWTDHWEWPLHERSDRQGCRSADAVVCVSDSVRRQAIELCGADPEKTHIVTNGVNTRLFSPDGPDERDTLGWPRDCRVALYVGALIPRKRVDVLIRALGQLDARWRLLIVGRGPERLRLEGLASELGLSERVRFWGYRPYPEVPILYRSADMLVLPSSYEGCPKVVLEGLACGLPVVAGGFELEEGALKDAITWLAADASAQTLAQAMGRAAQTRVTEALRRQLDWSERAAALDGIYQGMFAARGGA